MSPPSSDIAPKMNRWMLALGVTSLVLLLAYLLRYVLLPFAVAGGLAFVAAPAVRAVQRRFRLPRWAAATALFLGILALLGLMGLCLARYGFAELVSLLGNYSAIVEHFFITLCRGKTLRVGDKTLGAHDISQLLLGGARAGIDPRQIFANAGTVVALFMGLVMTLVLLFYFLLDGERIGRGALWLAPPGIRPRVLAIARRAGPMIFRYVGGIVIIMIYATLLTFGVTRYLLHVEHALILAIAVGFLELIPMIGPVLSIGLIAILAIEQLTFWGIIGVALFATALRVTIDQFVAPIVLGKSVDLPPPVIIFGFLAGGALWGVLGVIVAIPVAALVKIILQEVYGDGQRDGVK